jgi:hypothetical protein
MKFRFSNVVFMTIVLSVIVLCGTGFIPYKEGYANVNTSFTVDLPLNTWFSCANVCGPMARCSQTGEQCTSDRDCAGCQPQLRLNGDQSWGKKGNPKLNGSQRSQRIRGENDAGKNGGYSVLTSDIGSRALLTEGKEVERPPAYFQGVDQWRDTFNVGMELYNRRFNPSISVLPFLPRYPVRPSLSGEFRDDGPLAANAYL